jgi:hypothetical protein
MKKVAMGVMVLAVFAAVAHAEDKENPSVKTREQIKKESEAVDQQYQKTLRETDRNVTPAKSDPWANMRGSNNSQAK